MDAINSLLTSLIVTIIFICVMFGIFLYKHGKERKKEIRKTGDNKGSVGQHDKSCDDESSRASTAPASSTAPSKTSQSV
jgi:hypothetical protein